MLKEELGTSVSRLTIGTISGNNGLARRKYGILYQAFDIFFGSDIIRIVNKRDFKFGLSGDSNFPRYPNDRSIESGSGSGFKFAGELAKQARSQQYKFL